MPGVSRSRVLAARPEAVWRVVGDPDHLPRWWPRVARVESVSGDAFTQVLMTKKGKPVRADFRRLESDPPRRAAWQQVVAGTPFERLLQSATTEVRLEPDGEGTRITLTLDQKLRGWSRLGPFFFSGAAKRLADEALDGLEQACA